MIGLGRSGSPAVVAPAATRPRLAFAPMTRPTLSTVTLVLLGAGGLAACAPSPAKFSDAAADYIESEEVATWAQ